MEMINISILIPVCSVYCDNSLDPKELLHKFFRLWLLPKTIASNSENSGRPYLDTLSFGEMPFE